MWIRNGMILTPEGQLLPGDIEIQGRWISQVQFSCTSDAPESMAQSPMDRKPRQVPVDDKGAAEDRGAAADTDATEDTGATEDVDAAGNIVCPGFIDIHIHGSGGSDFSDGTQEALRVMATFLASRGVTSFLPTSMSLDEASLARCFQAAADWMAANSAPPNPALARCATLRGIHMEGPFLAPEKCGAQNPLHIIPPDVDLFFRLYRASGKTVRLVDVAPELPGALDFIAKVHQSSAAIISLAHTNADYSQTLEGFDAGASHVTHLFNGMNPLHHRSPGPIIAAAERAKYVELICDGNHLHPAVVRTAFNLFGPQRICLISDSMRACGMPDGSYTLGGQDVTVSRGKATLRDGALAGSVMDLAGCVRQAVSMGIPVEQALIAATANPAKAAGLSTVGTVEPGKEADLLLLQPDTLVPRAILLQGRWL